MVTSLRLALALVGCLSVVGCAAEPVTRGETPIQDSETAPPVRSSTSSDDRDDGEDGTLPVTPVTGDVDTTEDRLPPAQGGESPVIKPGPTTPAPTTPTAKTLSCTASSGEHSSLSTVTYTVTDGVVKISKMTILVKNSDARNANDADIFLTQKGSSETKMFWTDDVLASGKTIELAQAKTVAPKPGAVMRVETNFDKFLPGDPHADCNLTF